ncbi:hypothetical protein MNEG_6873 [Monoraphidium neglectum]|uniref:Uncharacterized protein n=1 Tax=Monoraphidium neglectum TaxID=145388 RepID=A0A0D2N523_9CHLO|nr:hypothetical protein MNEG_6873 [Monoraphidium neglectum]KIZ01086.1 hypothetical protein MNEG_6873 [Monoraphidium neglectum]|eukprot:XP_013900105.1 hypothetical protein MNEG_6873 [Monoraphidium neglectum]
MVIVLNVPLMILAIKKFDVLSLFLVTNLLCCCAAIPVALGLIRRANTFFTETGCVFGIATGVLTLTALGIGINWNPSDVAGSFAAGATWSWFTNGYDWRAFLTALVASTLGDVLWCAAASLLRARGIHGPGISGVLMRVPGMSHVTASQGWTRETQSKGWDDPAAHAVEGGEAAAAKDVEGAVAKAP